MNKGWMNFVDSSARLAKVTDGCDVDTNDLVTTASDLYWYISCILCLGSATTLRADARRCI